MYKVLETDDFLEWLSGLKDVNLHAKLIHYLHLTLIHPNDDVIFR